MTNTTHYQEHVGSHEGKHYKSTLFQGDYMMVGINCLEPGQIQPVHDHTGADKVYIVMEGQGHFMVGDESYEVSSGQVVWAPAGIPHGVENRGDTRLSILVCIAPPPGAG